MTPVGAQPRTTRPSDLRLRVLPLGKRIAGNGEGRRDESRREGAAESRRHPATVHTPAFAVGVARKYADDNGAAGLEPGSFRVRLRLSVVAGPGDDPRPRRRWATRSYQDVRGGAVDKQFPVIGQQLTGHVEALRRSSVIGLTVGLLGLLSGAAPGWPSPACSRWRRCGTCPARPGPGTCRGSAGRAVHRACSATGVIVTTGLAALGTFGRQRLVFVVLAELLAAVANVGLFFGGVPRDDPQGRAGRNLIRRHRRRGGLDRAAGRSAPGWCTTTCTATRSTASSVPCSAWWPGCTSRCR